MIYGVLEIWGKEHQGFIFWTSDIDFALEFVDMMLGDNRWRLVTVHK